MTAAPITLEGLTKRYGNRPALDRVDLTLTPGEVTAIVGPSGAGKSTLLRLLAGMEQPDAGTIKLGDTLIASPSTMTPPEARRIGLIFQDFALFPHLTVARNIAFGLHERTKAERAAEVDVWIERMGLSARRDAYPHELSGGEQQRVAIARALAPKPIAVLMDEPFSGLDPNLRGDIRGLALTTVRQAAIPSLLVTHDPLEALMDADKVAILNHGKLIQTGNPDAVYSQPISLGAAEALGPVISLPASDIPAPWQAFTKPGAALRFRPEAAQPGGENAAELTVESTRQIGLQTFLRVRTGGSILALRLPGALTATPGQALAISLNKALILSCE